MTLLTKEQMHAWLKKVCGSDQAAQAIEQASRTGRSQCLHLDGRRFGLVYNAANKEFIVQW